MISIDQGGGDDDAQLEQEVATFFSDKGALSASPDFEFRAEQQDMAVRIARCLSRGNPLVVEAGTGVGKSLAYLVPALLFGLPRKRKAVISTHTINLQEQLIQKDLPILARLLPGGFKAELLKGRGNYVCPNRLRRAMRGGSELFSSSEHEELKVIWEWAEDTQDGTLSDLDFSPSPSVWGQVCSESHVCNPRICGTSGHCFYQEARRKVAEADIVVLNHTLFFTLLPDPEDGEGMDGFLFPDDFVIFDEAHTLEGVAARQLGMRLSHSGLRFDLHRLYNPKSRKGLFQLAKYPEGVRATAELLDEAEEFFNAVEDACPFSGMGREFRVRKPELVDNTLGARLQRVAALAIDASEEAPNEATKMELLDLSRRLAMVRSGLGEFLDIAQDDHVYWVERRGQGKFPISMHGAPVDVAGQLRHLLFGEGRTSVLTSATLAVGGGDLGYFRQRVGAEDCEAVQIGSPFDYASQMKLFLVGAMPEPRADGYEDALERWISHLLMESEGRAFVLFTSYKLLQRMEERLQGFCDDQGWTLLTQGRGKPRNLLINEFKEDKSSVLFGTDSFWTGVDVPGEALSNVIITRLPFAVPDHPLIACRLEEIEARGGNPFVEYSVPEAVLKLRQGIGRLIRSGRDEGIAAILDNRILSKSYGRSFLAALPDCPRVVLKEEDCRC